MIGWLIVKAALWAAICGVGVLVMAVVVMVGLACLYQLALGRPL